MTPSQEKEFVGGFTGQGDTGTDPTSHIPASGKGTGETDTSFDDPPQSGYHGEKAPQGQEPPAPPREGDTSDGASAVFHDAEAEDTRGYSDEVTILLMVLVLVLPPILARFWTLRQARHILPLIKILG